MKDYLKNFFSKKNVILNTQDVNKDKADKHVDKQVSAQVKPPKDEPVDRAIIVQDLNEGKQETQPVQRVFVCNSSMTKIGSKIIGFDDESVDELELPDGSRFWAKNYYKSKWIEQKAENCTDYINVDLYGIAVIKTRYGLLRFNDNIIIEDNIVTQGKITNDEIEIKSPAATFRISDYIKFHKNGNIKEGYLTNDVQINNQVYSSGSKIQFSDDGNNSCFIYKGQLISLEVTNETEEELFQAIIDGDLVKVKNIVGTLKGFNKPIASIRDHNANPPFFHAVKNKLIDIAKYLISNGFDINSKDNEGNTALILQSEEGDDEFVKWLIENNTSLNEKNNVGETALIVATTFNNKNAVELLLKNGADVNIKETNEGDTALIISTKRRRKSFKNLEIDPEIIQLLIENGADVNATDNYGNSPLINLCENQNCDNIVNLLILKGADINVKNKFGFTPLFKACAGGNIRIAKILLANGADVNTKINDGSSPIGVAAYKGFLEIVELLIANKSDFNFKDNMGRTILTLAKNGGYTETIDLLIRNGAK
jgi:ankyrin repeat protein